MLYKVVVLVLYYALSAVAQLPSQDILALLQFKKGIRHDPTGYVVNSWNEESIDFNGCPSSWNGIVCNGGNVAGVVLDNLSLSAEADLSVFANLTMLVKLSMANNSISGEMPGNIGDMSQLEFLDLSNNLFSSILPAGVGNLKSLKNLSLAGNNLSGSIPDSLTKLPNLVYLNLSSNGFTKNIPKGFELMTNLKVLDLHGNSLDGDLDAQFLLSSNATYVDLSWNLLSSSDSQNEKFLPGISETIKYLDLSHNQLSGSLINAGDLQIFQNLKVLDLSNNQFSGELPGFNFVYDLDILRLSNNRFSGLLPSVLLKGDAGVLSELDLSGNNLSGPIPLITSTTLRVLNLSSNVLTGELPLLSGDLTVLDLSNNLFDGNLTRIIKWANLEFLDLSHNHLSGIIPEETPLFVRLNHLNLSRNSFTGPLPRILTQYPKLSVLDLSFNQLDGAVLPELLTLPTMQQLLLRNNSLNGRINLSVPSSPGPSLKVLDLSQNQLDGYFPDNIGSLLGLQVLNLGSNKLSGSLPNSLANLTLLSSFDISENSFTGEIPSNLSTTLQSFNASYNDLSGTVPENLRNFPRSSFFPGNKDLSFPNAAPDTSTQKSPSKKLFKALIAIACVLAVMILVLVTVFLCYIRKRRQTEHVSAASRTGGGTGRSLVVSAEDLIASRKESSSEGISNSPDIEKPKPTSNISPSKNSRTSWSPKSGDSNSAAENLGRLDVRSPDMLVGELHFLDDTIALNPEDLSRAPAEVLGRSSHGTSYRATLENGVFLTVKWLGEGVAKQKKEFIKEAKKFANIRHPNLVCLRGYYWGPTKHEKLLLMDYISPGSLASFLYDRPGRKGPILTWPQRLKIAVDVARGLNYLHFDRTIPHGNLKASNVLLEGPDLNARVSDYALHRLMTQTGTIEQILDAGVLGYRAPELANLNKPLPSFKADVYAFGVILMEILTGRSAGDVIADDNAGSALADWVRRKVAGGRGSECFDAELGEELRNAVTDKAMKEVMGIGLRCIRSVSERPGIRTVYEDLSSV